MTGEFHGLYPLKAIVCGYEKSGTTLLNELLRRHPKMDSGFEGGFLLGESPRQFPTAWPYYGFFQSKWNMTKADMDYVCNTDDWGECYRRVRERSPIITDKSVFLFDKTPIYMLHLSEVLSRVPGIPCIVNVRDPRALMLSWARWSGHTDDAEQWISGNLQEYCARYASYAEGYAKAMLQYSDRIFLNKFEELCTDPIPRLQAIFRFLGLEFSEEYLSFSSDHFVYGNTVSTAYIQPYRDTLTDEICKEILAGTSNYHQWHYQP
jgi:hypothetical protein